MPSVTKAAVIGLIQQLKPNNSMVQKVSQGKRATETPIHIEQLLVGSFQPNSDQTKRIKESGNYNKVQN